MRSILLTAIGLTVVAVGCDGNPVSRETRKREAVPQIEDAAADTSGNASSTNISPRTTGNSPVAGESVELPAEITFTRDVAPIVFDNCVVCHRANGSAPFALLTYEDVASRADQIVDVTHSGAMPPWPPANGVGKFVNARALDARQLAILEAWAPGKTEGDPENLPASPVFSSRWVLGQPQLIVKSPQPVAIPAGDREARRTFVIPLPVLRPRFVTDVEFRTDNERVVRHAVMRIQATTSWLDPDDPASGFATKGDPQRTPGELPRIADEQVLGWTPGKTPLPLPEGVAWQLNPGNVLVITLQLQPSGKDEQVTYQVAFHFADTLPEQEVFSLQLGPRTIELPAVASAGTRTDAYTLPVAVDVLSIFPQASDDCREILVTAERPDGAVVELISIPAWESHWQDEYRYDQPIRLPPGTVLTMHYQYDNAAADPGVSASATPPPTAAGEQTAAETGSVVLQVTAPSRKDLAELRRDYAHFQVEPQLAAAEASLVDDPRDASAAAAAGEIYLLLHEVEPAIERFSQAVESEPKVPQYHARLAAAYKRAGLIEEAIEEYERAVAEGRDEFETLLAAASGLASLERYEAATAAANRAAELAPRSAAAPYMLARIHLAQRDDQAARPALLAAIERQPDHAEARTSLGDLYMRQRQYRQAIEHYQAALDARPTQMAARVNLANLYLQNKRLDLAAENYRAILEVFPEEMDVLSRMGGIKAIQREFDAAGGYFQQILEIDPENSEALTNLGRISEQAGDPHAAFRFYRRAIELKPAPELATLRIVWLLSTSKDPTLRDGKLAVQIVERLAPILRSCPPGCLTYSPPRTPRTGSFSRRRR